MMRKFLAVVLTMVMTFISLCVPAIAMPTEINNEGGPGINVYLNADTISAEKEVDGNIISLEYSSLNGTYALYFNGEPVNCEIHEDGLVIYNDLDSNESEIVGQSLAAFVTYFGVKELVAVVVAAAAAVVASNPITSLPYADINWTSGLYYDGDTAKEDPEAIVIDSAGTKISSKVWLNVDDAIKPNSFEPVYYVADIADGGIKLGAVLTEIQAIAWLRAGYSIYTEQNLDALVIAGKASPNGAIAEHGKHGKDSCTRTYYLHYHPQGIQSAYNPDHWPHVWYKS